MVLAIVFGGPTRPRTIEKYGTLAPGGIVTGYRDSRLQPGIAPGSARDLAKQALGHIPGSATIVNVPDYAVRTDTGRKVVLAGYAPCEVRGSYVF